MLIKHLTAEVVRLTIADGVSISVGNLVGVSSGEAVLSDKDVLISVVGFAKSVQDGIVYVQTEGKFANSDNGDNFWLGTNGALVSSVPTTGMVQQVAKRVDSANILIDIDKTVIIL